METVKYIEVERGKEKETLAVLEMLRSNPGWKLFLQYVEVQMNTQIDKLSTDGIQPQEVLRRAGVMAALRSVTSWVDTQVKVIKQQLDAQEKRDGRTERREPGRQIPELEYRSRNSGRGDL